MTILKTTAVLLMLAALTACGQGGVASSGRLETAALNWDSMMAGDDISASPSNQALIAMR